MFVFYKLLKSFADLPGSYYVFKYLIYYIFPLSFKRVGGWAAVKNSLALSRKHTFYICSMAGNCLHCIQMVVK